MNGQESVCDPAVGAEQADGEGCLVCKAVPHVRYLSHSLRFHKIVSFLLKDVTNGELKGLRAV